MENIFDKIYVEMKNYSMRYKKPTCITMNHKAYEELYRCACDYINDFKYNGEKPTVFGLRIILSDDVKKDEFLFSHSDL